MWRGIKRCLRRVSLVSCCIFFLFSSTLLFPGTVVSAIFVFVWGGVSGRMRAQIIMSDALPVARPPEGSTMIACLHLELTVGRLNGIVDEWDDRNLLYSLRFDLGAAVLIPSSDDLKETYVLYSYSWSILLKLYFQSYPSRQGEIVC